MHPVEDFSVSDSLAALPDHILENILARIPLPSVGAARCVSKQWRALTTSPTFLAAYSQLQEQSESWLYVNSHRFKITDTSSADPSFSPSFKTPDHSWGAGGIMYSLSDSSPLPQKFSYRLSALHPEWQDTPALIQPRVLPVVCAIKNLKNGAYKVVCAGGLLSDTSKMEALSKVELFDSELKTWEECEDLPVEFQGLVTSRSVTAVVCHRKLFLFHIYSGIITSFDVVTKRWSKVVTLRRPDMEYCYLAVHNCEPLLVEVSNENNNFLFWGWKMDRASTKCMGESWPVLCHFAGVQSKPVGASKEFKLEATPFQTCVDVSSPAITVQPIVCKYFATVAGSFSKKFTRITEVVNSVLEFCRAIS